ncbi:Gfo/Idh/MocA family oxidoreductase [Streptomyces sp. JJ36]|nr:Gfo/Idh/MocA family oxidoreductase [Streptomyces sp. JJ36]
MGLGVLGAADIAVRRVLPAVSRTPGVELAAVASRDPERAGAVVREFGGAVLPGYPEVLADPRVHAVYVPLPAALHGRWVRAALEAGKHVLAEKPLTTDARETAALVDRARRSGLVLRENYMFVHHPQHRTVRRLLAEGAVGRVRVVSAAFTIPPRPAADIRYRAALGGGALFDVGGYPLRAARMLLGPGLRVTGAVLRRDPARDGVDVAGSVLLHRADGAAAQLSFGMEHHYTSRYEVLGSAGRLRLDHAFTPPADHRPVVVLERAAGTERRELEPYDQCLGAVQAFVRAVQSGRADSGAGGEDPVQQAELTAGVHRLAQYALGGDPR